MSKTCTTTAPELHAADNQCSIRTVVDIPITDGGYVGTFISFVGLAGQEEHLAIGLGPWRTAEVPLVRLHSECLTGDVFGSQKCDCGRQLHEAIQKIHEQGGLLLYLRQEGRGIGLFNKLEAYRLQASGMDTFQANRALGFDRDLRDYTVAAQMLNALGRKRVRLLSNNPDKFQQLADHGIEITERLPTGVYCNDHNRTYLSAKVKLAGHSIVMEDSQ